MPSSTSQRCLRFLVICCLISSGQANQVPDSYCTPSDLSRWQSSGWPKELDVGLYWFGPNDQMEKATSADKSQFYDPKKPTMIYFHGWTGFGRDSQNRKGWTVICKRITTRCLADMCPEGGGQLLAENWLKGGWNVGFFYWDQFADEDCARDAEQKIWFDRKGDGFRWKSYDIGTGQETWQNYEKAGIVSVAEMCKTTLATALGGFTGPQMRFVGHSIGSQLATRCAALLHAENHPASPHRLALLEPYFSKHNHMYFFNCHAGRTHLSTADGLGDFAAESTVAYIKSLWERKQVVTEVYKSSVLTEKQNSGSSGIDKLEKMGLGLVKHGVAGGLENELLGTIADGEKNSDLEKHAAMIRYEPEWCSGVPSNTLGDVGHVFCRHCAVFPMYFMSLGLPAPPIDPAPRLDNAQAGSALASCPTPSASCTDGQIREWISRQLTLKGAQAWSQEAMGRSTFTVADDRYSLSPGTDQTFQLVDMGAANDFVEEKPVELKRQASLLERILVPEIVVPVVGALVLFVMIAICFAMRKSGSSDDSDSDDFFEDEESRKASRSLIAKGLPTIDSDTIEAHNMRTGYEGLISTGGSYQAQRPISEGQLSAPVSFSSFQGVRPGSGMVTGQNGL